MATELDPHKTPVKGTIAALVTLLVTVASVSAVGAWKTAVILTRVEINQETESKERALLATKQDLLDLKRQCAADCREQTLASIAKDGFACYSTPLRGENFRRCDLRSNPR